MRLRDARARRRARAERGMALVVVLLTISLLTALGGGVVAIAVTERRIAAAYRDGVQAFYAAEGFLDLLVAELRDEAHVEAVFGRRAMSRFVDPSAPVPADVEGGWRLYANGRMPSVAVNPSIDLVAWIADDADVGGSTVGLRVEAHGGSGARRRIDAAVAGIPDDPRLLSWKEPD